jgi:hypothetical protein
MLDQQKNIVIILVSLETLCGEIESESLDTTHTYTIIAISSFNFDISSRNFVLLLFLLTSRSQA